MHQKEIRIRFRVQKMVSLCKVLVIVAVMCLGLAGCSSARKSGSGKGQANQQMAGDSITSATLEFSGFYIDASKEKILGNFSRAESMFREGIKTNPRHHPSYYQLADIHHIKGDYAESLYWIELAVRLSPDNVWYRALYADVLLKLGRYRDAVVIYRWLNTQRPGYRLWYEARAFAQAGAGDPRGAAATYRSILEDFGYDEAIFLKMIGIYEKMNDHKRVEQSLQWLIRKYPYDTRYLGALAGFYQHRGKPSKAFPLWQEILRLEPGNGEVRFDLANYYRSRGEDQKAFQELFEAFQSPNLSIDAKIVVMLSYYNLTEKYPVLLPEAYQLLEVLVKRHPENPKGWSMYGDFLFRDRQFPAALEKMQRVVTLDSTRYLVWEQLLHSAWLLNDFGVLRTEGDRALTMFPDQAMLYLYRGMGLLYGERPVEALAVFQQGYYFAGFNDSVAATFMHGVARAQEVIGEASKAAESYRKASAKGAMSASMVADQLRFAVTWGYKDQIESLNRAVMAGKGKGDPMWMVAELWSVLARGGGAGEVTIPLNMLLTRYPDHFLVHEHATFIFLHLTMKEEAHRTWQRAQTLSKGNLMKPVTD